MLVHVDSVEVQLGDDGIVVARAGIDVEDLEPQRPVGLRAVAVNAKGCLLSIAVLLLYVSSTSFNVLRGRLQTTHV